MLNERCCYCFDLWGHLVAQGAHVGGAKSHQPPTSSTSRLPTTHVVDNHISNLEPFAKLDETEYELEDEENVN